jgi:hypothetical protein
LALTDKSVKYRTPLPNLGSVDAVAAPALLPPVALASPEERANPTAVPPPTQGPRTRSNRLDSDHPLPPDEDSGELSDVYSISQLIAANAIHGPLGLFAAQHPPTKGHVRNSGDGACAADDTSYRVAHEISPESELHVLVSKAVAPILSLLECEETGWAVLESRQVPPGAGTPPIQAAHHDFSQSCVKRHHDAQLKTHARATYPWTLLVALSAEARLIVYRHGRRSLPRVVRLPLPGDAVLFRGDVWHGGDTYRATHWRYHMYLEPTPHHTTNVGSSFRSDSNAQDDTAIQGLFDVQGVAVSPDSEYGWQPTFRGCYPTGATLYTGLFHRVEDLKLAIL